MLATACCSQSHKLAFALLLVPPLLLLFPSILLIQLNTQLVYY